MWGSNYYGQCGDGNTLPIKIIEYIYEGYAPNQEPVSEEDDYEYDDEYSDYSMSDIYMLDQCFSYSDDSLASLGADDSTASFSNLEPYTDYIFYLLRERETEDPLSAENVLYITQETSDGDGRLSIMYIPREMVSDAEGFVVKQWEYVESEIEDGDLGDESEVPDGLWLAGLETLVYDGTKQLQDIRVYDGKTLLTEKTDYTLSYKNNKNAYTLKPADAGFDSKKAPQLTVVMKGNYSGSQTIYFNIDPLSIEGVAFDGIQKKKGKILYPVLLWNGRALKEKTDYTVNGGQITGKGNFSGTRDVLSDESETVTMSKVKIGKIDALTYKGSAYTTEDMKDILEDKLTYNGVALVNGSDYMISKIINGKNIGAMTIVVQGLKNKESKIGPLSGEKRINIKIAPYNLSGNDISVTDKYGSDDITTEHKKGGAKPTIKVLFNGNVLKQGRDYTIAYTNNKTTVGNIKKPTIIVSGKGNYTGKRTVEFVISQKPFTEEAGIRVLASDIVMSKNTKKYQTKIQVFDSDGVLLKPGQDYDKNIVYKRGNVALDKNSTVDIGDEITVEITGSGKDYSSDTITATYRVLPATTDISKAAIKIKDQSYTGHEIKITGTSQILSASIGKSKTALNISVDGGKTGDFIVVPGSYTNNVQKGTAKVTLKGINGYGGYKTVSFKIGTRSILEWWKGLFG